MFASAVEAVKTLRSHKGPRPYARRRETPDAVLAADELAQTLACPICASDMVVRDATRIDDTGVSKFALHAMRCDTCGMVLDRLYHPSTGYETGISI